MENIRRNAIEMARYVSNSLGFTRRDAPVGILEQPQIDEPEENSGSTNSSYFGDTNSYAELIEERTAGQIFEGGDATSRGIAFSRANDQNGNFMEEDSRNPAVLRYYTPQPGNRHPDYENIDNLPVLAPDNNGDIPIPQRFVIEGMAGRHIYPGIVERIRAPQATVELLGDNVFLRNINIPIATQTERLPSDLTAYGGFVPHEALRDEPLGQLIDPPIPNYIVNPEERRNYIIRRRQETERSARLMMERIERGRIARELQQQIIGIPENDEAYAQQQAQARQIHQQQQQAQQGDNRVYEFR